MRSASYSSWRARAKVLAKKRGKYQRKKASVAADTGLASWRIPRSIFIQLSRVR